MKLLWALAGGLCSTRLAPLIRTSLPVLERFEEINLNSEQKRKLLAISPATIDRLLAPERQKHLRERKKGEKFGKEFLDAGKKRLQGDTVREATSSEVEDLKKENEQLKALVAEQALKIWIYKRSLNGLDSDSGNH